MNVAALLQDSPSDDSHRRRQQPPPSTSNSGPQEHGEHGGGGGGSGGGGERGDRGERGGGGGERGRGADWAAYDRTRVQSQNQNTWPPPYQSRPGHASPSTPISTETSPYAHPKDSSWNQNVGNPYPPSAPPPPGSAPYEPTPSVPSSRMRAGSNAAAHPPPPPGPGVPPPPPPGSSYMPPPEYSHPPSSHHHKGPPPPPGASPPIFPTPVSVAGQSRVPMSHSPPIGGSPYASGPPPPSSSTPRRPPSHLSTPQPPHAHGPPSSHPSPAMASLQNPPLPNSPWGPGVTGPPMVDGRESQLRDRNPPALTSERERERAADRDRELSLSLRDREREMEYQRDRARGKPPPVGPGVPPQQLPGPGTGAPPPVGPGVPPMAGPGIPGRTPEDPHKISSSSAPASGVPSRAHSRSQLARDDPLDHGRELDRGPRIPERDVPPPGPGRPHDYPPPREQHPYPREDIHGTPSSRRDREEYIGPGGPVGSSRLPPPPASYRTSGEFGREPPPPHEYRRDHPEYRRPADYPREPPHPQRDYRREPPEYRREPGPPAEHRRDPSGVDYRRDPQAPEYHDYRREPATPADYRREPPSDYRRETHPPEYRGPDYRDTRRERDLPPPPGPGRSPEAYRRGAPEYRRERDIPEYPSSRRNSNEARRERPGERERAMYEREMRDREREAELRRADPGPGPGIPPGERQPRRSPHQTRDLNRDPYARRYEDYRRDPPPGQPPHDYRGGPPPPHPSEDYRSEYRSLPGDHRREPLPPADYPPRREHAPPMQDYRRDEYHPHPPGPPPPMHPGHDSRPPPGPPGEYRGPPGPDYRRDAPPGPPPPQDYHRGPPSEFRGPPGSLPPPPGDYPRPGPPPHGQEYRGPEPGEIPPGREYPRRDRDRDHPRGSGDYSRAPPVDYPPPRRRDDGEYTGRSAPPPGSVPSGPGVPGRTATPTSEAYVVKHPSERERERDRDRERWEREQRERERAHYPPGSQPPTGPPPSGNAPPPHHHSHPHSHPKSHSHPHHHHQHHHHVIHSHPHQGPSSSGPPPPPGGSSVQGGPPPPPGQGGAPPPSQRQLQSQFPTRFVSVTTHPGSRMGSPVPGGGPPGPGGPGVVGPGGPVGGSSSRKDVPVSTGKDKKMMSSSSRGPPGPPVPGSETRRRDEREKDRERERVEREVYPPQPPPHRGEPGGRILGHGYPPPGPHGVHHHGPHGQPYDDYMPVDGMDPQQVAAQQAQMEQQQMQIHSQHHPHPHHPHHPHPHSHVHPHAHPHQLQHQPPSSVIPHHALPPAPQAGFYPGPQEGVPVPPSVEELWSTPPDQPDREVKSRNKINLGTFVYPNTPFPYYFDIGEWVGVNSLNGEQGTEKNTEKDENRTEGEGVSEKVEGEQKEKDMADKKMDVDVEGVTKAKATEKDKEAGEIKEKEGGKEKEVEKAGEKEEVADKEKTGEVQVIEKSTSQKDEADDMLDVETRATILIPNGYIPREKPPKPAIWGGGVIGRSISPPRRALPSSDKDKPDEPVRPKKRRIYTDDSDLFLCALHSGWLTWSASARARERGQDLRVEVRVIRCTGAGAGSVYATGAGAFAGKYAPGVNGVVVTNGEFLKENEDGKPPVVRKEEIVGRFIGGWGEKCFTKGSDAETEDEEENSEENDGRGLVSAGWGSGHDGSAIEVLNVEFVNKGTSRSAPGLGRRNRSQRLSEYNERRAAVLGLQRLAAAPRLAGRKRRRNASGWMSVRRMPNASVLDVIPELQEDEMTDDEQAPTEMPCAAEKKEEAQLMAVRTVMFGTGLAGDMRLGYKYQPDVLKEILFPLPTSSTLDRPPPRKRRRTTIVSEDILMEEQPDAEPPAPTPNRPVILETPKESYLLSLTHGSEYSPEGRKYDISLILEGEVEEDREDAVVLLVADKNAKPVETPPLTPPADDDEPSDPAPTSSATGTVAPVKPTDEAQPKSDKSMQEPTTSRQHSPSTTAPQTETTDISKADTNDSASIPPPSTQDVSMADAVSKTSTQVVKKILKHPVAQVLQRRVGHDMFKFTTEGISIVDVEEGMPTEWLVQVKSWKWATRKIVRV